MLARTRSILLVRHGQSEWNALRRWQGRADTPLTALGRRQAVLASRDLALLPPFGAVWSSPLSRAAETASIIAAELGRAVSTDDRLVESDAGEWQGLTPDEIERAYPGFLRDHRRPPTFETFSSVVERSTAALVDITSALARAADDRPVLVVAHSGVLRSIVRHLGAPDERIPNLGGVWVTSSISGDDFRLSLGDRFRPAGVDVPVVDAGGEDPGEQPDHADADGRAER